jgi:DNA anti-recombination protein RmuC
MMQTSWTQSAVVDAPDLPVQAQTMGNETGSDFAFAVYEQLARIHRELGALTTSQLQLDAYVKDSEVRFTDLARESELRLTKLSEESEKRLTKLGEESEKRLTKLGEEAERRWAKSSEEAEKRWARSSEEAEKRWAQSGAESEKRLTQLSRESEERFERRVGKVEQRADKLETSALERVKTTEDKLSSLKDFVHRLFWTGTGIVAVLGVTLGWKPIWLWVSTHSL